ncbi:two-component system sensor histidine kinase PhoQ [Natronocella acetinitrilica]|uniref:histidine kinase n=1 Tax=Natronocella acetinitrilica TaxID=414046 RepID=A0AAE3G275_9GAMM|nr:ATP-binding protein [Natronocella acetinitrilica]MCP1673793.1 two-component system sensor histidine kinase PhoQ [Natronocella acetinitrilica]
MKRTSLGRRLLLASTLVAAVFLGLTGLALDQAYRSSLAEATRDRLQNHVYTLLAAARLDGGQLQVPSDLPEARFHHPESGLYGRIRDGSGNTIWQSESLLGLHWPMGPIPAPGELTYSLLELDQEGNRSLSYGLSWEDPDTGTGVFIVDVAESRADGLRQLGAFRQTLWGWLGAAAAALLITQALIQRWGLAPLHRAVRELQEVRRGRQDVLQSEYPQELEPLTDGINRLLRAERERRRQVQHSLADLAHSLKTPLTVLRGALENPGDGRSRQDVLDQINRIDASVRYQLARAGRSRERMGDQTPVRPVAERLLRTVAALRQPLPLLDLDCDATVHFPGPEEELLELLGNLVENATRYCDGNIRLAAMDNGPGTLTLVVEDDGPGISEASRQRVLDRGERADEQAPGSGIGLAVVADLCRAYGGTITIDTGDLGGARITLTIPMPA